MYISGTYSWFANQRNIMGRKEGIAYGYSTPPTPTDLTMIWLKKRNVKSEQTPAKVKQGEQFNSMLIRLAENFIRPCRCLKTNEEIDKNASQVPINVNKWLTNHLIFRLL
jgi:hypothetical protein